MLSENMEGSDPQCAPILGVQAFGLLPFVTFPVVGEFLMLLGSQAKHEALNCHMLFASANQCGE